MSHISRLNEKHLVGAHKALVRVRTSERRYTRTCAWVPGHTLHESGNLAAEFVISRTGAMKPDRVLLSAPAAWYWSLVTCLHALLVLRHVRPTPLLPPLPSMQGVSCCHVSNCRWTSVLRSLAWARSNSWTPVLISQIRSDSLQMAIRSHTKMVEIANEFEIWISPCLYLPTFGIWSGFALLIVPELFRCVLVWV